MGLVVAPRSRFGWHTWPYLRDADFGIAREAGGLGEIEAETQSRAGKTTRPHSARCFVSHFVGRKSRLAGFMQSSNPNWAGHGGQSHPRYATFHETFFLAFSKSRPLFLCIEVNALEMSRHHPQESTGSCCSPCEQIPPLGPPAPAPQSLRSLLNFNKCTK